MIFVLVDIGVQVKAYERNPQETLRQKVNKRALKRQEVKERKKLVSEHWYNLDLLMDLDMCYVRSDNHMVCERMFGSTACQSSTRSDSAVKKTHVYMGTQEELELQINAHIKRRNCV